jgi:hypothetical protein
MDKIKDFFEDSKKVISSKIEASIGTADRLAYSVQRAIEIKAAPLDADSIKYFNDFDMETMDAHLYRYGSLISRIQDAIFKLIAELEQENMSTMSSRDKANLMKRIGALPSAQEFSILVIIRNKLMHDYPEETSKHLERINFITEEAPELLKIFAGIVKYCEKFGIHKSFDQFDHPSRFLDRELASEDRPKKRNFSMLNIKPNKLEIHHGW